jgi:hypothetical protein
VSGEAERAEGCAGQAKSPGGQEGGFRARALDDHSAEGASGGHGHGNDGKGPGERLGGAAAGSQQEREQQGPPIQTSSWPVESSA